MIQVRKPYFVFDKNWSFQIFIFFKWLNLGTSEKFDNVAGWKRIISPLTVTMVMTETSDREEIGRNYGLKTLPGLGQRPSHPVFSSHLLLNASFPFHTFPITLSLRPNPPPSPSPPCSPHFTFFLPALSFIKPFIACALLLALHISA